MTEATPAAVPDISLNLSRSFANLFRAPQEFAAYNQFSDRKPGPNGLLAGHLHYHRAYQGMALTAMGGKDKAAEKLRDALKEPEKHPEMAAELAEVKKRLEAGGVTDVNDPKALEKLKTWVSDSKVGPASMALNKLANPEYQNWIQAIKSKTPDLDTKNSAKFFDAARKYSATAPAPAKTTP